MKYLGLVIDSTLKLDEHAAIISGGLRSTARAIRHIRPSLDIKQASAVAVSLGLTRLDSSNAILSGAFTKTINSLQRAQNALARAVLIKPLLSHHIPMLHDLHWLPVSQRIEFKQLVLCYKTLNDLLPPYITSKLHLQPPPRALSCYAALVLQQPHARIKFTSRRFSYTFPMLWNSLPPHIRSCTSLLQFRKLLKHICSPNSKHNFSI
jgi:hypothetical protein